MMSEKPVVTTVDGQVTTVVTTEVTIAEEMSSIDKEEVAKRAQRLQEKVTKAAIDSAKEAAWGCEQQQERGGCKGGEQR